MEPETGSPRVRGSQTVYLRHLSLPDLHSAWQPLLPHQTELPVYISGKQPQTHNATCYISCVAPAIIQPWVNILVNTNSPIVYWNGKYATSELNLLKNNYHLNLLLLLNLPAWLAFLTDIAMSTVNQDEMGLSIVAPAQIDVQYGQTCASLCLNHIAGLCLNHKLLVCSSSGSPLKHSMSQ